MGMLRCIAPRRASLAGGILVLAAAAVLGLGAAGLAGAAGLNFQVNSTADAVDAQIGNGVCATSSGACTLRAAIQETNAVPGADAIQVPAGTYALGIPPGGGTGGATGDLDITDSLTITGAGAPSTIVDGGTPPGGAPPEVRGLDRLFEVLVDGGAVSFSGLTLSDGFAAEYGGAIMNGSTAMVTIADSVVRGSTAGKTGGGIENHVGGRILVRNSTLTQNYAVEGGSALNNNLDGFVELTDSTVSANSAAVVGLDETLRGAGAIANNAEHDEVGTLVVTGSQISDNRAGGGRSGAGIWNKGLGSVSVEETTFSKNVADADGGAIYSGPGQVSVADSTFSENSANNGAAISSGGSLTVLDGVFLKNVAEDWGGGIHNFNLGGVTVRSSSFTENSALSGGGFANEGSGVVTVESSTFTKNNAVVSAVLDSGDGGGMHSNAGGEVSITDGTFTANTARAGGGFSNNGGHVVVAGTRFSANTADERGGGILVEGGDVRMVAIDVVGNLSKSVDEGGGGISYAGDKSVSVGESAAIESSRIRDNKSDGEGGGIDSRGDGPLVIATTSVTGNTAAVGGAIHHVGDAPLLVTRSTLSGNIAENGGGAFTDGDGEATVENSTVSTNRAGQFGGGLLVSARLTIKHSTVTGNNAPSGGGVNNGGGDLIGDGLVFLANTIVAGNPTGGNCAGTMTSLGGNLENTNTCQLVQPGDQPGTNPVLGALADNGGLTQTHALLSGSPAQDAAVCTEVDPCPPVDQRGVARPLFAGHDVGAYESELVPGGEPPPPAPGVCPKFPNSLSADGDSWISQGSPSSNSGSDSSLKVKSQSGSNSRALVRFALPPLPDGCTTIASAVLRLEAASAKEGRTLAALQAAAAWSETGVTWSNQPATAGPAATTASGQDRLEWDVTAQTLGSYVSGNHGFLIRDAAENGGGDEQSFNSREKPADGPPELLLVFDDSNPETTIDTGPVSPTDQTEATFAFSSDRADSSFECSLDGAAFQACDSPHVMGDLAEGGHTFRVRATRRVRAVDPTPASHGWTVAIPPETFVAGPESPSASASATLTFSSDDPGATFECSLNGAPFAACISPVEYANLGDGPQEVRVRAVDPFGNVDPAPAVHVWTVAVPPETTITGGPVDPSNSTSAGFEFSGSDNGTAPSELAFECRLDGGSFAACGSPASYELLAEGRHSFEVRAIDRAGNVDASPAASSWTIDLTPPQTAVDSGPPDPSNSSSAEFSFSADEEVTFACSLDGAPFAPCSGPQRHEGLAEGAHRFEVRAIDRAGNVDASPAVHSWTIDLTPPEAAIDAGPADPTNSTSASFAFSADEEASFECRLDGAPFAACSTPQSYPGLAEGGHAFDVRAIDRAGNVDESPARFGWTIDLTSPDTAIVAQPADPTSDTAASFDFSAGEAAVFECRLDGGSFAACGSPASYELLAEGRHSFEVRAIDRAGNVDASPAASSWTIDLTPPQTAVDSGPPDPSNSSSAEFSFSADEGASFACSLDGAPLEACSSPASYVGLAEGLHTFEVEAVDAAGNADSSPALYAWTTDLTPPDTTIDRSPADPTKETSATLVFSAGEASTFECRLDGAPFAACSSPAGYEGLLEGVHTFDVRAIDRAGNADPAPARSTWTIDLTPPESTIEVRPADPTADTSATLVFAAGEAASFECRVDGGAFAVCSSPASYDGLAEGRHRFEVRATDRAGNVEPSVSAAEWTVDLTPPQTSLDSGPPNPSNSSAAGFAFSADENASFVCALDGAPFEACSSPASYQGFAEGRHTFQVRAIDGAGNVDASPAAAEWTIDLTPPETTIDEQPADPTAATSASFTFSADEDSEFECRLDGASFVACSSPQAYAALAEGAHAFDVRAIDRAGNADPTPARAVWTIDLTAPETAIDARPYDPTNSASATFVLSANEQATFACSLDGAPFAACSSPAGYEGLGEGRHTFEVRATDRVGNSDATPAAYAWTVDRTAPETTIVAGPADPTNSTSTDFSFSSDEPGSTFACALDGAPFEACGLAATYAGLEPGTHVFQVRATDPAGNSDPTAATHSWTIDVTALETTIDGGPADPTNETSAGFAFSAGEAASFQCRLDGESFAACTSPHAYTGLAEGAHAFDVRAVDSAGNVDPTPARYAWTIDVTPPETTIEAGPADPTNGTSASLTFSSDELGSAFACSLDGAPFAPCSTPKSYDGMVEGSHTFAVRAIDPAGNTDESAASHAWRVDTTPPETAIAEGPADPTNGGTATFTFSAGEASSFDCRLDGASFVACASPHLYVGLGEGSHSFEVRALDGAGNIDTSPASYRWTVDRTAPETIIGSGPPATTTNTTAAFSFSASEAGTFECSLDGSAFAACTSPRQYSALAVGGHEFSVRARDTAGNTDASAAIYSWTVEAADTTAPETTIDSGPPALTSSTAATFAFSSTEPSSSFQCSLDGAAFAGCSSPHLYNGLANGVHQFRVRATDASGNVDATPAAYSWTIDTAAPNTTIDAGPPALTANTSATFSFSSSEASSTFQCSLDGAAFAGCSSPSQYTGLAQGAHQFRVRASDAAGNVDQTPAAHSWTIDSVAPETTITSGPPATTTSTSASFSFSANEAGSTFECSLDAATFSACSSPRQYSGLAVGSHQFRVRARDAAGNIDGSPATSSWTISPPSAGCPAPTTVTAIADAWIDENSASSNKGSDSILKVQSKGPRDNFRALVRFQLPPVPAGCAIDGATLRLFAASMKPGRILEAAPLATAWAENAVSWSNQPPTTGAVATTASGFGYREWDVSSQVQAILVAGANNGFLIRDAVEGADAEQQFHSREKGESPPQLVVRFSSG